MHWNWLWGFILSSSTSHFLPFHLIPSICSRVTKASHHGSPCARLLHFDEITLHQNLPILVSFYYITSSCFPESSLIWQSSHYYIWVQQQQVRWEEKKRELLRGTKEIGTKAVWWTKSKGQTKGRNREINSKVNSWGNQEQGGPELNRKRVVMNWNQPCLFLSGEIFEDRKKSNRSWYLPSQTVQE